MGGNWKLNPVTLAEATNLASDLVKLTKDTKGVDIAVFPPYPYIAPVAEKLRGSNIKVSGALFCMLMRFTARTICNLALLMRSTMKYMTLNRALSA
jgi:hypothetical protein